MLLRSPKFWLSLLSAAAVGWLVLGKAGRDAPGPLAAVHGRVVDLGGFRACAQCHGGWTHTMAQSCIACHEDIGKQLTGRHGLHGTLSAADAEGCALCHSDHHGEGFAMVNRQSFARMGIGRVEDFKHDVVGFPMAGKHLTLACKTCHVHAETAVLPEGSKRYLGLQRDCKTCHTDPHEGRMVQTCATCHTQVSFDRLHALEHDKHLPLTGGHANLGCRDCHAKGDPHSLEVLGSTQDRSPRGCVDCHQSPHQPSFVDGVAALAKLPGAKSCAACHKADHDSFQAETLLVTPEQHAVSGFALADQHAGLACGKCHGGERGYKERYPGRKALDCRQCHEDAHRGQFDKAPDAERGCISCHDAKHFAPHAFTVERHAKTGFPLTGHHAGADCHACHKIPDDAGVRSFAGTRSDCAQCHEDAHRGFFDGHAAELGKTRYGTCAACHQTSGFAERPAGGFDHARFTGFPIHGAHAQVECEACHRKAEQADARGRTFGVIADRTGPVQKGGASCVACHQDPHHGEFDRLGMFREVDGQTGCLRCHGSASFRTLDQPFDHGKWTKFELLGGHAKLACASCHARLRAPDDHGRTWARAPGMQCADCHAEPHQRQFEERGRTDCRKCHRPDRSFQDLAFNHDIHSRFRLGEAHRGVACDKCHLTVKEKGAEFVRYKPMKRNCVDCHGAQEDPFRRRGKSR